MSSTNLGVGAIQHELLNAGLRSAVDVEGSSAFIAVAKEEDERQGHTDRTAYLHGDFVALAEQVEHADIVTLDRVICCYPDMPKLVGLSAARANKAYGLVFPRDTWWMKAGAWFVNLWERLNRDPLLFYVHAAPDVDATIAQHGLHLHTHRSIGLWQVRVYTPDVMIAFGGASRYHGRWTWFSPDGLPGSSQAFR